MTNIHTAAGTLGMVLCQASPLIDPIDFSYFTTITKDAWNRAKALSKQASQTLPGTDFSRYMRNHGPVEMAGAFVFKTYLDYYCPLAYDAEVTADPFVSPFRIAGREIAVHTRMFKTSPAEPNGTPRLHVKKFMFTVPEIGLRRRVDLFVFCGFDVRTLTGYVCAWATAEEIAAIPLRTDIQQPAKCLPICDARPISSLIPSLTV